MNSILESFFFVLQMLRESPKEHLGKKSLDYLVRFWRGYLFRYITELWEKDTGLSFIENYDKTMDFTSLLPDSNFMGQFTKFVHSHYNRTMSGNDVMTLITKNSNSEDEAFDKYFELHDAFVEQWKCRGDGSIG